MAISFIGSATGVDSCTIPTHQVGDLILIYAYRDGNTTSPSLPAGFSSAIDGFNIAWGSNANSMLLGWKIATTTSETSGIWTNATSIACHVYRGCDTTQPLGAYNYNSLSSTTVSYYEPTWWNGNAWVFGLRNQTGSSWVVGFAGHTSVDTALETSPTGMVNRSNVVDATDELSGHDTNGGVTSWPSTSVSVGGTSSGWLSITVELMEPHPWWHTWWWNEASGNSVTVTGFNSPAAGQTLVLSVLAESGATESTITFPSGFIRIGSRYTPNAYGQKVEVAYKIADGTETTFTASATGATYIAMSYVSVAGVNPSAGVEFNTGVTSPGTTLNVALTPTFDKTKAFYLHSVASSLGFDTANAFTSWTSGFDEAFETTDNFVKLGIAAKTDFEGDGESVTVTSALVNDTIVGVLVAFAAAPVTETIAVDTKTFALSPVDVLLNAVENVPVTSKAFNATFNTVNTNTVENVPVTSKTFNATFNTVNTNAVEHVPVTRKEFVVTSPALLINVKQSVPVNTKSFTLTTIDARATESIPVTTKTFTATFAVDVTTLDTVYIPTKPFIVTINEVILYEDPTKVTPHILVWGLG